MVHGRVNGNLVLQIGRGNLTLSIEASFILYVPSDSGWGLIWDAGRFARWKQDGIRFNSSCIYRFTHTLRRIWVGLWAELLYLASGGEIGGVDR